jgi:hypothetical protein
MIELCGKNAQLLLLGENCLHLAALKIHFGKTEIIAV